MIYLYIKTHNLTGLKYLGKTTQDPYTYKGSGKRWLNHIKKHGNNVTTEVIGQYENIDEFKREALRISEMCNVVSSDTWANLIPETGSGGDTSSFIDYSKINRGKGISYEERYGIKKASELKKIRSITFSKRKGKKYEEIFGLEKAKQLRLLRGIVSKKANTGKKLSAETKLKISQKVKGRIYLSCSCVKCKRTIGVNNLSKHYKTHS